MLVSNSDKVKDLRDRVMHVKKHLPNCTPMVFCKKYPSYIKVYNKVINVLNLKSTDSAMTKKLEKMLQEYQKELQKEKTA